MNFQFEFRRDGRFFGNDLQLGQPREITGLKNGRIDGCDDGVANFVVSVESVLVHEAVDVAATRAAESGLGGGRACERCAAMKAMVDRNGLRGTQSTHSHRRAHAPVHQMGCCRPVGPDPRRGWGFIG